jgi:hypothetical protein
MPEIKNIPPMKALEFKEGLHTLASLLHTILENPALAKDLPFLQEAQKAICSLNEISKL